MRVLTFTSLFPNSDSPAHGIFVYQRMSHFANRPGNEVVAVAPVPYFPSWLPASRWSGHGRIPKWEQIGNVSVYHPRYLLVPKISMPLHGLLMFLGSVQLVRQLQKQAKFDLIDTHYVYPDGFAAVLLGQILGLPVIVSARGTDINLFPSFPAIRPMIRWTLQRAAGVIAVCTPLLEAMLKLGLSPTKAAVIGNGVDVQRFRRVEQATARQQLGLPLKSKIIVSVGGLIPRKGFHFLIPALTQMRGDHREVMLYIIGRGPSHNELQALIDKLGLQNRAVLVGPRPNDELPLWYSAADVCCLSSSREGWANVILESMACGTPVVATGVWGTPEVIVSPDLGVIVDQKTASIAEGLDLALSKKWDCARIIQYAQLRTWDVVAGEMAQFFQTQLQLASRRVTAPVRSSL